MNPKATGRPAYHPATMLKLYVYGYLNRIQSTRRLERETGRNIELMWLPGRLTPGFKTIANFRRHNGKAIRKVCAEFVGLCRKLDLFSQALVAIDGKQVNNRFVCIFEAACILFSLTQRSNKVVSVGFSLSGIDEWIVSRILSKNCS